MVHLCEGDVSENFAVPFHNGSTYNWTIKGSANIANIISGNGTEHIQIDLNNPGVFWLHVLETDINSCVAVDSILVEVHPKPNPLIYADGNIFFCEGDFVTLISDSVYENMFWNNGEIHSSVIIDTAGVYFLDVIDSNGCTNISNAINVVVYPKPVPNFSFDGVCFGIETNLIDNSIISSGNIISWIWNLGDGSYDLGSNISHLYSNTDIYDVTLKVVSDFGCSDSLSKNLEIFYVPDAQFEFNPKTISILNPVVNFSNTTNNVSSFLWNFDDGKDTTIEDPIHIFSDPGIYEVMLTVMDDNNCIDSVSHNVTVMYDFILYIPNTFTPDGDGKNELFKPKGFRMEKYQSYQFIIYNRWGIEVYKTDNFTEGWDGLNATSGKYAWAIIITDEMGTKQKRVGDVLLIR